MKRTENVYTLKIVDKNTLEPIKEMYLGKLRENSLFQLRHFQFDDDNPSIFKMINRKDTGYWRVVWGKNVIRKLKNGIKIGTNVPNKAYKANKAYETIQSVLDFIEENGNGDGNVLVVFETEF